MVRPSQKRKKRGGFELERLNAISDLDFALERAALIDFNTGARLCTTWNANRISNLRNCGRHMNPAKFVDDRILIDQTLDLIPIRRCSRQAQFDAATRRYHDL